MADKRPCKALRAFLSGPMSDDAHCHVNDFIDAHRRLQALGIGYIFNPAFKWVGEMDSGMTEGTHEYYVRECINELTRPMFDGMDGGVRLSPYYDVLVQLHGWSYSKGARLERDVARACGIDVVPIDEFEGWLAGR